MQPTGNLLAMDLRVQHYATQPGQTAQPVLTYWKGYLKGPGDGDGQGVILNQSYQQIATVSAGDGYAKDGIDAHELTLTPGGDAFVTVYAPTRHNLTSVGGPPNGTVIDSIVQEINVRTGKVVWEWHALGHVPLRDTHAGTPTPGQPYNAYHINSIQQLSNGNVVISMRMTWAAYEISKKTGHIVWELGGKHSTFKMGSGTRFYWQHDAELHSHGLLTVFDDGATPPEEKQSRALEIHLDLRHKKATLVRAFEHKPRLLAYSEGNMQLLPNGKVFVGWGTVPKGMASGYSEYSPNGHQIFAGSFVWPVSSYRAYRFPWTGMPTYPPAIAVRSTSKTNAYDVYASWNGATQVAKWQVLGATSEAGTYTALGSPASGSGFETKIPVRTGKTNDTWFEVEALGAKNQPLQNGTSQPAAPEAP